MSNATNMSVTSIPPVTRNEKVEHKGKEYGEEVKRYKEQKTFTKLKISSFSVLCYFLTKELPGRVKYDTYGFQL